MTQKKSDSKGKGIEGSWLLSLSDLLTLLLAVIVVTAHLHPEGIQAEAADVTDMSRVTSEEDLVGIGIAMSKESQEEQVVYFSSDDFDLGSGEFQSQANKHLKLLGNLIDEAPAAITIVSCHPSKGEEEEMSWFYSMSQALTVHRQFLDGGSVADQVSVSIVGPFCKELSEGLSPLATHYNQGADVENVVAVKLSWNQKHG